MHENAAGGRSLSKRWHRHLNMKGLRYRSEEDIWESTGYATPIHYHGEMMRALSTKRENPTAIRILIPHKKRGLNNKGALQYGND